MGKHPQPITPHKYAIGVSDKSNGSPEQPDEEKTPVTPKPEPPTPVTRETKPLSPMAAMQTRFFRQFSNQRALRLEQSQKSKPFQPQERVEARGIPPAMGKWRPADFVRQSRSEPNNYLVYVLYDDEDAPYAVGHVVPKHQVRRP